MIAVGRHYVVVWERAGTGSIPTGPTSFLASLVTSRALESARAADIPPGRREVALPPSAAIDTVELCFEFGSCCALPIPGGNP